jgi:nucleoside phosphorylase
MGESVGVVIFTPMNLEYKAVRAHLQDSRQIWHPAGTAADIGTVSGLPWPVAIVLTGEGNAETGVLAERVSTWLRPRALLVVGVAGGLKDDIGLGDIVVATWVYGYHSGKESRSGFQARPRAWRSHHRLEQAARLAEVKGTWAESGQPQPTVHFKPIAAGDVVLNSKASPLARQLQQTCNDAAAIEMESAGAASAAHLSDSLPVLTVRGISDKADGRKHLSDAAGLQPIAAAHAAAFTMAILRELSAAMPADLPRETGTQGLAPAWRSLAQQLPAVWPLDLGVPRPRGMAILELCLLPAEPVPPLEARRLAALPLELARLGRAFAPTLEAFQGDNSAAVAIATGVGLAITRRGERCAWQPLPHDTVGSILDEADVAARLTDLLSALTAIDAPRPREAGLAAAVSSSVLLAEGRVADLPRTSARGRTSLTPVQVPAADALPWGRISAHPADVAAELAARLLLAFRVPRNSAAL